MAIRRLAFLAALALLPASAEADMHPLDCLVGATASKSDTETASEEDDGTVYRYRLNCTGLLFEAQPVTGATAANGGQDYDFVMAPAIVASIGDSRSAEFLVGVVGYLRGWEHWEPRFQVLAAGFATTDARTQRSASVIGVALDYRTGCPSKEGFLKKACEFVRPGARLAVDEIFFWNKSPVTRVTASIGLRLELGEHDH